MTRHPEQDLIDILITGDLDGVDPDMDQEVYDKWRAANNQISPEGRAEYQRQSLVVSKELEQRSMIPLYNMDPNSTKH